MKHLFDIIGLGTLAFLGHAGDSHALLWAGGCLAGFLLALTAFKFYIDNPEHGENK